jgi:glycogen debranching enzyme
LASPILTILEGSTFCVSDEIGDVNGGIHGVFDDDTRMLSTWRLFLDGVAPLALTARPTGYYSATHFLRNAASSSVPPDSLSVSRERFVDDGVKERLVVRNESMSELSFELGMVIGADFADVISVKACETAFGDPQVAPRLPPEIRGIATGGHSLTLSDGAGYATTVAFSRRPTFSSSGVVFQLDLAPHERWELTSAVSFGTEASAPSELDPGAFGTELEHVRRTLDAWDLRVPRLVTGWQALQRTYERSIADLASLRLSGIEGIGELPAAGMPWFMTVFGRDTIIASLQTLLFGPELALGALRSLAALQALEDDPRIDAEPGKIVHELRRGKAAETWFPIYYGSVDSTPLFLILLSEVWRWSGDDTIVRELESSARLALDWLDRYGDRDGDGFVEYLRRSPRGLVNQSWKDSGDSQRFRDGRMATPPIAPAEVQGYAFDAKRRLAEIARDVWDDEPLAGRLERDADDLRRRFDDAYWMDDRHGYALALDDEKRQVDSLCSNIGHLLWSGIVPLERREDVARTLLSDELWSGWGVRTMAASDAAYNPLSYHNGTVWPHDTAFLAWGLDRNGFHAEAAHVVESLIEAAPYFDHSLPEVFAGYSRAETTFPVPFPTAARPQAWAAGTPVLCLRLLLSIHPDRGRGELASDRPVMPALGGSRLTGVRALGRVWTVAVEDGAVVIEPSG